MIEINLLPEELKTQIKSPGFDLKNLLYLIPLGCSIIILLHIYLGVINISLSNKYRVLNAKWKEVEPQIKALEDTKKENNLSSQDAAAIEQFIKERVNWAEKLNKLSLHLPSGVWFNQFIVKNNEFILKAAVVSEEKEEMGLINQFLSSLKADKQFSGDFKNLELGPVKREILNSYDIVNFSITGTVK